MIMLRWSLILVFIFGLIGCATTKEDWGNAQNLNTIEAYQEFLQKYPNSGFSKEAQTKLEPLYYQMAKDTNTAISYSAYLARYPQGVHTDEVRAKLKESRCLETSMVRSFQSWLRKGQLSDPQRGGRLTLGDTYIGIPPSNIGQGYKVAGDDPAYPIQIEWGRDYLIYLGGRGIIVGQDGITVLVGYECE